MSARMLLPQGEDGKCWNGEQGTGGDFVDGMARRVGNDGLNFFAYWGLAQMPSISVGETLSVFQNEPLGENNTNLGIFGADLGFIPEALIGGSARLVKSGLALRGSNAAQTSFSHMIPNRWGGPRSILNGRVVPNSQHSLHDPHYFLRGTTASDKLNPALRALDRVPPVHRGTAAGAAVGALNGGC